MMNTGSAEEMIPPRHGALREPCSQVAPGRVVESPQPKGGPSPRGMATLNERVVQTARQLVLAPLCEADLHDGSSGSRPKRDAKHAALALRADRYNRAWGVVARDCQASCTSIPPRTRLTLSTRRSADGRRLPLSTPTLTVGVASKGQVVPTQGGGPPGAPISPLSSTIDLHLVEHLWPSRGSPAQLGATLPRDADDAILVCRSSPQPVRAACEGIAKRMDVTSNRDQTRVTRVPNGCDCMGCNCVTRRSPRRGKQALDMCPAQSAQQKMRHRLQSVTARRAPSSPKACVEMVHPMGLGWLNSCRHTHARQAVRGVPRFVNIRLRRYLPQRRTGRGFGGKRFPHSKLSAMGRVDMGSGRRA
jgi:RNA-directed DNA polymerase